MKGTNSRPVAIDPSFPGMKDDLDYRGCCMESNKWASKKIENTNMLKEGKIQLPLVNN